MRKKKASKLFKVATAFTVAASPIVIAIPAQANVNPFSDVSPTSEYYEPIMSLYNRGIVHGFSDGTYRPNALVTRGQAAKIIAGILNLKATSQSLSFSDLTPSYAHYHAIAALKEKGMIDGFPDGTFKPDEPITRNQMAKMIANAFNLLATEEVFLPFTDVTEQYRTFIEALYANAVTKGRTATTFDGNAYVTRAQLAAFVVRAEKIIAEPVTETLSFTVDNFANGGIVIEGKTYTYSDAVRSLFNSANKQALQNATLSVVVENGVITHVHTVELNRSGTAEQPLTLNAPISIQSLTVNADHLVVRNVTVAATTTLTSAAQSAITFDRVNLEGALSLGTSSSTGSPTVTFTGSQVAQVKIQAPRATVVSDNMLAQVTLGQAVQQLTLTGAVDTVQVDSMANVTVAGQATIGTFHVANAIAMNLTITGTIANVVVGNPNTRITVSGGTTVTDYTLPAGAALGAIVTQSTGDQTSSGGSRSSGGGSSSGGSSGGSTTPPVTVQKSFTYTDASTRTHYIGDVYTAPIVTDEMGAEVAPTGSVNVNVAGTYTLTYAQVGYTTLTITVNVEAKKDFVFTGNRFINSLIGEAFTSPKVKDADNNEVTPTANFVDIHTEGTYLITYEKPGYHSLTLTVTVTAVPLKMFSYNGASTTLTHYIGDVYTAPIVKDETGAVVATSADTVDIQTTGTYTLTHTKEGYFPLTITVHVEAKRDFTYTGVNSLTYYIGDPYTVPAVKDAAGDAVTPTGFVDVSVVGTYTLTYEKIGYNPLTLTVNVEAKKDFAYNGQAVLTHLSGDVYTAPMVTDETGAAVTPTGSVDANRAGTYTLTYTQAGYHTLVITVNVEGKKDFIYQGSATLTHYIGDVYTAPAVTDEAGNAVTPTGTVDENTAGTYTLTYEQAGYNARILTVNVEAKKDFAYNGQAVLTHLSGDPYTAPIVKDAAGNAVTPTGTVDASTAGTYLLTYEQLGYNPLSITVNVLAKKDFSYQGNTVLTHYIGDSYVAPTVKDEAGNTVIPTGSVDENMAGAYTLAYEQTGYNSLSITVNVLAKKDFSYQGSTVLTHYIGDSYVAPTVRDEAGNAVTPTGTVDENTAGTYTLTYEQAGYNTRTLTVNVEAKKSFTYAGVNSLNHIVNTAFTMPIIQDENGNAMTPTGSVNENALGTYTLTYEKTGYETRTITVQVVDLLTFDYSGAQTLTLYTDDTFMPPVVKDQDDTPMIPNGAVTAGTAGTYLLTYTKAGYRDLRITVEIKPLKALIIDQLGPITIYENASLTYPEVKDSTGASVSPSTTINTTVPGTYTLSYVKVNYETLTVTVNVLALQSFNGATNNAQYTTLRNDMSFTLPTITDVDGTPITPREHLDVSTVGLKTVTYEKVGYHTLKLYVDVQAAFTPQFYITGTNTVIATNEIELYRTAADRDSGTAAITNKTTLAAGTYYYKVTKPNYRTANGAITISGNIVQIPLVEVKQFTVTVPAGVTLQNGIQITAIKEQQGNVSATYINAVVAPGNNANTYTFEMSKSTYDNQFTHSSVTKRYVRINNIEYLVKPVGTGYELEALAFEGYKSGQGNGSTNNTRLSQFTGSYLTVKITSPTDEFTEVTSDIALPSSSLNLNKVGDEICNVINLIDPGASYTIVQTGSTEYQLVLQTKTKKMQVQLLEKTSPPGPNMSQNAINTNFGGYFYLYTEAWANKPTIGSSSSTIYD